MTDFILFLFILWAAVMVVGLIITLMPLILAIVGFCLTIGFFTLIGTAFAHILA